MKNKFGEGILLNEEALGNKIYASCCACMSIYSEFLSWANANINRMVKSPNEADSIVVLSCQVTDLAILNDIKTMEQMIKEYSNKKIFVGGCLAKRFDIELPLGVLRLDNIKKDYQYIEDKTLVKFLPPFWVKDFVEYEKDEFFQGNLFRHSYPLRVGAGCLGDCEYCTIKHTRGKCYYLDTDKLIKEFLDHEDVVLISDSPTVKQIKEWCAVAKLHNKPISFRNIEPIVTMMCFKELKELSNAKLLKVLHTPVQSTNLNVLEAMKRNREYTLQVIENIYKLKASNYTRLATNIIIDYNSDIESSNLKEYTLELKGRFFDYISWNPYWDGNWNREKAEKRFEYYLSNDFFK